MGYWLIAPAMFAATPAMAATAVFDNGAANFLDGYSISAGQRVAEDFTFSGDTVVSGGTLYQIGFGSGALNYYIYSSSGVQPATLVATGAAAITRTALTPPSSFTQYRTDFTLATTFTAVANTEYWIAFGYSGGGTAIWSTTAASASDNSRRLSSGSWLDQSGYDLAFSLVGEASAVPEPASWAMMIAGFGAVGGALRRGRGQIGRLSAA